MTNQTPLDIYEKFYLQESEIKEKITIRIQIAFTLIVAEVTVSSYMLRMLDYGWNWCAAWSIVVFALAFLMLLSFSSYYVVRAFWGNEFRLMPLAGDFKSYREALNKYNNDALVYNDYLSAGGAGKPVELIDVDDMFAIHVSDKYEECATHNAVINQERSRRAHQAFRYLLWSFIPLGVAGLIFVGFDMDASSPRKDLRIIDEYAGEQIAKVEEVLRLMAENNHDTKEIDQTMTDKKSNSSSDKVTTTTSTSSSGERSERVAPVAPVMPEGTNSRITLDDINGFTFEISNGPQSK